MDGDRGSSAPASDAAHLDASSSHQDKSSHKSDSKKAHKKDKAAAAAAAAATAAAASTTTTESTSEPVSPRRVSMSAPASEPSPRKERSPRTTDNAAPHDSSKSPRRSSAPSAAPEKSPRKEARVKSPRSSKDRGGKEAAGAELDAAATADGARHRSTGKAKKSRSKSLPHGELDSLDPRKDRNGNRKQPKTLDALLGTTETVPSVSERKAQLKRVSSAGSSIQTTSSLAPLSHKAEQPASKSTSTDATLETTEQLAAATDGDDGGDGGGGSHSVSSEGAAAADEHHSLAKAADAADAPPLGDTTLNERPKRGKRSQKDRKAALMQSELQERQVKDVDTDTEDESSRPRSATTTCIDGVKYIDLSGNRPPDSAPTAFAIAPSSSNNSNPPATSATNRRTERLRARAPITKQESAPYKSRKGSDGTGGPGGVTIPGKAKFFAILDKFGGTSSKKKPADITIKRSNSNSQLPTTSNELTRSLDASPNNFNSDLTTTTTTTTATPGTASADSTVARVPSANGSQSMPTVAAASSPPTASAIAAAAAATTTPMSAHSTDSDLTSSSSTPGVSSPLTDSDALSPSPVVPEQADASPPKRTRPLSEREKVLSELLHTERDYVRDLSILIEVFFQPCKERSILSQQDLTTLFNNLEILYDLNGEILADLERRMASLGLGESEPLITVGDIFLRLAEYFKLYTHYCINLDNQNRVFHQAELNEQFAEFLKECKRNPRCRQLELPDFLIKPMQRLCKYPLILKELLTHTTEDHPDYDNLVAARPKVQDVVRYVNERKRVGENQQIIIDIQHSIEGCGRLLEASRRFIKQGQLFTYENKQRHRRQIFLFNDLILLAKPKSSSVFVSSAEGTEFQKYINVARVPMEHVRIVDVADAGEVKNGFELARKDTQEKFTILCDTPDMKREWIRNIKTIVKEYQKAEYIANKDRMLREAEAREVRRLAFRSLAQSSAEPTHDQNSDAWTLGLILWSMYTQRPLFEGFTPAQAAIALMTRQFHPEITPDIPDSLAEILQDCWLENRDARPNFSMVYDQIRLLDDVQWPATKPFNL